MPEQQNLFNKREAGGSQQNTSRLLHEFEREAIGTIKKRRITISSGKNIRKIVESYEKRWTNE